MILLLVLVTLTGPENQQISINPEEVVTTRAPRAGEHFAAGTKCLIHTTDGKFITVKEDCDVVRNKLAK